MEVVTMDLWSELPFSDTSSLSSLPPWPGPAEQQEQVGSASAPEPKSSLASVHLDHFTYPDYQLLPCDYVIRPSDMLLCSSLDSHNNYQGFMETMPMNYPPSSAARPLLRLSDDTENEEEHVKLAKRVGLIQHLPTGTYDGCRKNRECVICMIEFILGDSVRYLPCMHTYHVECINSWLMRSFTCPSCMEPVDAALLTSYETN